MTTDPAGQYYSPYLAMGNNRISGVDPDGGFFQELKNFILHGKFISNSGLDFLNNNPTATYDNWVGSLTKGYAKLSNVEGDCTVSIITSNGVDDFNFKGFASFQIETLSALWNSDAARILVPDALSIGVGFNGIFGVGGGVSFDANFIVRGPNASIIPHFSSTQTVGGGFDVSATVNIGGTNYIGPVSGIDRNMFNTYPGKGGVPVYGSGGVAMAPKVAGTLAVSRNSISRILQIGGGLPVGPIPVNFSAGVQTQVGLWKR